MRFEPRLLGFLCNWCSYSAADSAGSAHFEYPPNIRVVRVMCSGRVDPSLVLHALKNGIDGVLVCGCHLGDCHYTSGNCKMIARFGILNKMLESMGVEPERLSIHSVSAGEAGEYAKLVTEMTEKIRALGPFNWTGLQNRTAEG